MAKNKNATNKLPWNEAYNILNELLVKYYEVHGANSPIHLYGIVEDTNNFISNEKWFKNIKTYKLNGIDPIQIFASFNNNKQRAEVRYHMYCQWIEFLNGKESIDAIDFQGCPSPLTIKILSGRSLDEQVDIWRVYYEVLKKGDEILNDYLLSNIKSWYGINFTSFTIFLYWIDSKSYLSLDKNTTNYLLNNMEKFVVPKTFSDYHKLLRIIPKGLNKTIVSVAYDHTLITALAPSQRSALSKFTTAKIKGKISSAEAKISFRLIAIKIGEGLPLKIRKNLKVDIYDFYKAYKIEGDVISINRRELFDIYSHETNNVNISIHAIVGKNGSGKSALSELLFIAINNLYYKYADNPSGMNYDWIPDIDLQIYFESYGLFCIEFKDEKIVAYEYLGIGENRYQKDENQIKIDMSFMEKFFYSISVNYSLYGLNSRHSEWLEKLFVKNDGYENPIVLEPNRVNAQIDIHRQEELARSRFLANLIDLLEIENLHTANPDDISMHWDESQSVRYIRKNIKVSYIKLELNNSKTTIIFENSDRSKINAKVHVDGYERIIDTLGKEFDIAMDTLIAIDFDDNNSLESISLRYIVQKLFKIASSYKPYVSNFWDPQTGQLKDAQGYISLLKTDSTHVINKLFQAINFLRKTISYQAGKYELDAILANIIAAKMQYSGTGGDELRTIHLLPPAFFKIELEITNHESKSNVPYPFENLSSGERQQIYSVNSIVYHLKNLDSISFEERITYRCANIILDEVELYAHPEMQRKYVNDFLTLIKKFEWIQLSGINICFITHSPFILSDIPAERILFLDQNGSPSSLIKTKTFGANIHELLVDGFFLSNTIGDFAINKIAEIVAFHSLVLDANEDSLDSLKDEFKVKRSIFAYTINAVGEDYLSGILKNHITDIEKRLDKEYFQKEKISELEKEIESLKKQINA